MKKLALAQFFSWSALFIMWINTTPVVAQYFFGSADPAQLRLPGRGQPGRHSVRDLQRCRRDRRFDPASLAQQPHRQGPHPYGLPARGAAAYASFLFIRDPQWLVLSEIGVGIAWASILAMPYAILASSLPQRKLGIYMGLFNIFIVVPQLLVATVMGSIMKAAFPDEPIWTMLVAAVVMALAALAMLRVNEAKA